MTEDTEWVYVTTPGSDYREKLAIQKGRRRRRPIIDPEEWRVCNPEDVGVTIEVAWTPGPAPRPGAAQPRRDD